MLDALIGELSEPSFEGDRLFSSWFKFLGEIYLLPKVVELFASFVVTLLNY